MPDERPILILSASTGAGHTTAARALREAFTSLRPALSVESHDALALTNPAFRWAYGGGYMTAVRILPGLIGWLTNLTDDPARDGRPRSSTPRLFVRRLERWLIRRRPRLVIHTHFLSANIVGRLCARGRVDCKNAIVVTDFEAHRMWAQPADLYCVGGERARDDLVACGVDANHVRVTGIPLRPQFAALPSSADARKALAIEPDQHLVLLFCNACNPDAITIAFDQLVKRTDTTVVAIAGRDARLQSRLQCRVAQARHRVLGFTENVGVWMRAADVIISKPGGLTSSEMLAAHTPLVIFSPIPGPELRNSDYLLEQGAAIKVNRPQTLGARVGELLADRDRRARMAAAAARIAYPEAATTIVQAAMDLIESAPENRATPPCQPPPASPPPARYTDR